MERDNARIETQKVLVKHGAEERIQERLQQDWEADRKDKHLSNRNVMSFVSHFTNRD
jgi:hypothetical protein